LSAERLLLELLERGLQLWSEGGSLRFRAPPGVVDEALRTRLAERKAELLALLGEGRRLAPTAPGQRRLWLGERLEGAGAYNVALAWRVEGPLDPAALRRALQAVVDRHEALRTGFALLDGGPVQAIHARAAVELPLLDAGADLDAVLTEAADASFDLAGPSLLRARLFRSAGGEQALLLVLHHTVCDTRSLAVLLGDLAFAYAAACADREPVWPAPAASFADRAVAERLRPEESVQAALAHWRRRLGGLEPLELPADRRPSEDGPRRGGQLPFLLPPETAAKLRTLARAQGVTPFMLLLAALGLLLGRLSGRDSLAIACPVTRREGGAEPIGFCADTLLLRLDLAAAPDLPALLAQARERLGEAFAHRAAPFERIVETLTAEGVAGETLTQLLFTHQETAAGDGGLMLGPGVTLRPLALARRSVQAALVLETAETEQGLVGGLAYDADRFAPASAERLLQGFRCLLTAMAEAPAGPLATLPLEPPEALAARLAACNDTARPYPRDASIPALFAEQVKARPEAPALVFGAERLSYAELDRRSDSLAAALRARGVGLDRPVAVFLERSAAMVVAWLGILKAGGGYLPLDPDYPSARLAFMLADSGATPVVTDGALAERLPPGSETLLLDDLPGAVPESLPAIPAEALAYIAYTSGSTGRPKGAAVPQRAVLRLVCNADYCPLGPEDRVAQVSSASFDAATFEVWGALLNGGCLVGIDTPTALAPAAFAAALARGDGGGGITALFLTTALFNAMVREAPEAFAGLTHLLTGGEAQDPDLCRRLLQAGGPRRLLNVYGPTETTTFATWHPMAGLPAEAPRVPIGRPIGNSTAYVLDRALRPLPPLAVGEVWLGGDGLCRGYHGRPDLTAERFRPDPFSTRPGARLYRSGDLGRWLPDGSLDLIGRADEQIKIRGFRVEPGEVEAALRALPGVAAALALTRPAAEGGRRLLAWVVPAADAALDGAALREALAQRLPAYLVPAAVIPVPAWPLNTNGKIDREALPLPEAAATTEDEAPATPLEAAIAAIWAELLELPAVGRHQDFFALGGHSLAASRLAARLRAVLGVELPLRSLFEARSVAALARLVEGERRQAPERIPRLPPEAPLPLSPAQERLWFLAQLEEGGAHYNVPFALRLRGPLDVGALQRALAGLTARHELLRCAFVEIAGRPVLQPAEVAPALPIESLAPEALETRLREEAAKPFDLARPPLLRARLFRLGAEEQVLFLCLHHLVCDGWSLGILLRELAALHAEAAGAGPAALPPLPLRYADYAAWQRTRLQDAALEPLLEDWRARLQGVAALTLPPDRPRPRQPSHAGAVVRFRLPPETLAGLQALAQAEGATLFSVLLAGVAALLGLWSDQEEGVLGTALAGRDHPETEPLVGLFVQTLPLALDLSGDPSARALIGRARDSLLAAEAGRAVPFERIVEALQPERDTSRSPLFQVMVLLQNMPLAAAPLPGLSLEPLPLDAAGAKFDLTVSAFETPEGLLGGLEYATDLFEPATIEAFARRLESLLSVMAAAPDRPPALPPEAEPAAWQGALPAAPAPPVTEALIAPTARLVEGERVLAGAELEAAVESFTAALRAAGAGPEVVVGLALPRSLEMVVGLLAILRAGAVWLPLDPALPAARRAHYARDAGARLLVARPGTASELGLEAVELFPSLIPAAPSPQPLSHEGRGAKSTGHAFCAPSPLVGEGRGEGAAPHPDQAAYLLYTSGSTGAPKGVVVTHGALANHMRWMLRALPLQAEDRVVQRTAPGFDAAVWEILAPLMAGATLLLPPAGEGFGPAELAAFATEREATVLQLVPSLLAALLEEPGFAACGSLRRICCGGEGLPADLAARLQALHAVELVNLYGPTEATIQTVVQQAEGGESAALVPIGRPIDATRAYVLDRRLRPLPTGMAGELFLAGPALARGYRGRPDLTAERFLPDPFAAAPGERMLATGDRARRRPDGTLEWLGRRDAQLKLRGFRLEPGEIEAALRALPGVADAAVLPREGPGGPRLVAYLRRRGDVEPRPAALRAALAERLPAWMIPAAWVPLDDFPRLPSGKLDRRALPEPPPEETPEEAEALSPLEQVVAAAFAEVLERPAVGRHADFFALGGHSLLAVRVAARLRAALGRDLPLGLLFEAPSPAALARRLEAEAGAAPLPPLRPADRSRPLPLSAAQRRLWFLQQVGQGGGYAMAGAVAFDGPLDLPALQRTLDALVARHESLRTTFHATETGPVQRVQPPAPLPLPLLEIEEPELEEAQQRALAEPFDLETGPPLRVALYRLGPEHHRLLLLQHHIASDGWSMALLSGELTALYQAFRAGAPSPLPPLALHYADYAAWQAQARDPGAQAEALARATARLRGAPPLRLPLDRPRSETAGWEGASRPLALGRSESDRLAATAAAAGATPFMLTLAAFAALLQRRGAGDDLLLGSDLADRPLPETEAMQGFFVEQLVLRLDLGGDPTTSVLLGRVRDQLLQAYAERAAGFEELVAAHEPERPSGTTPLVQAKLSFQAPPAGSGDRPLPEGLRFVAVPPRAVPFDLMVNLMQTPEGLQGAFLYRRALFEAATIDSLAAGFETLLRAMAAEPDRPLSELSDGPGPADFRRSGLARLQRRRR